MRALLFKLFLIFQLILATGVSVVQAEVTREQRRNEFHANRNAARCEADATRNREIIAHCNANWEAWGITPSPPANELRQENECSSDAGANFLRGCASAVAAPFVFLGSLGALGIAHMVVQEDENSDRYIFRNGTQEQIMTRLAENWMIERCGLGAVREAEFMQQNCGSRPEDHIEGSRDCNPFLEQLREQQACRRASETRSAYREARQQLESRAAEIFRQQQEHNQQVETHENSRREIQQDCGQHINPYRSSFITRWGSTASLTREALHQLRPNPEHVAAFNECVRSHPNATDEIVNELMEDSRGLVDAAVTEYESFQCYNATIRNELYCDIAAAVLSGGALAAKSLTRLGRRGVRGALAPDASDVARNLQRFRQNPDFADVMARARQELGRDLTEAEQEALYRAHAVGRGQAGADGSPAAVGNYTEAQIREKARILSEAFPDRGDRRLLLEAGIAGDVSPSMEAFRNAYRANDFSGENQYASALFSNADGSIDRRPIQILGRNEDGGLRIRAQGDNGEVFEMDYPAGPNNDNLRTIRQSGTAQTFFQQRARQNLNNFIEDGQTIRVSSIRGNPREGVLTSIGNVNGREFVVLRAADGSESRLWLDQLDLDTLQAIDTRRVAGAGDIPPTEPDLTPRPTNPNPSAPPNQNVPRGPPNRAIAEVTPTERVATQGGIDRAIDGEVYGPRGSYWYQWYGEGGRNAIENLPEQGWKLHVSARLENAGAVAETLLPIFRQRGWAHKVIGDIDNYQGTLQRGGTQVGKFITVYPRNEVEARQMAQVIEQAMQSRGFRDSDFIPVPGEDYVSPGVYARYGRITGGPLHDASGNPIPGSNNMLLDPQGRLVPDPRGSARPGFVQPLGR